MGGRGQEGGVQPVIFGCILLYPATCSRSSVDESSVADGVDWDIEMWVLFDMCVVS